MDTSNVSPKPASRKVACEHCLYHYSLCFGLIFWFFLVSPTLYSGSSPSLPKLNIPLPDNYDTCKPAQADTLLFVNMTIDGHVYNATNGVGIPGTDVNFYNKTTMTFQYHTTTDNSGYYNAPFIYTGQSNLKPTLADKIYPNPSTGQTNVVFNAKESGTYKVMVTDISGRQLYESDVQAQEGANQFTLNGGNAGAHIITLTNDKGDNHSLKSIQTVSAGAGFSNGSVQLSVSILFIILGSLEFPCGGMTGGRRLEGSPPQGMVYIL